MVSLKTCPHVGFSRKRSIEPSSLVMTMPKSSGFSMAFRPMVASAPRSSWNFTMADRSMSVMTSPAMTRKRSSSSSRALRTEPAVPSGLSSVAYWMRTPNSDPSPKYVRTLLAMNETVTTRSSKPCSFSSRMMCSIIGWLTSGIIAFCWLEVRGRSRLPSPPAMITAFIGRQRLSCLGSSCRRRRYPPFGQSPAGEGDVGDGGVQTEGEAGYGAGPREHVGQAVPRQVLRVSREEEREGEHQAEGARLAGPLHVDPAGAEGGQRQHDQRHQPFADDHGEAQPQRHRAVNHDADDTDAQQDAVGRRVEDLPQGRHLP